MSELLTSWKEISNYFGKGVRTVQRWESNLGLPIHRPNGANGNVLFAVPSELDAWVAASKAARSEVLEPDAAMLRIQQLESELSSLRAKLADYEDRLNALPPKQHVTGPREPFDTL